MRLFEFHETNGLFACVNFSDDTVAALTEYQKANNVQNPLEDDFHSTVVYHTKPLPKFQALGDIDWQGKFTGLDIFNHDEDGGNCLVIKFSCPELEQRWKDCCDMGAEWDYDEFRPHITLSYDAGDIDLDSFPPFEGPINMVKEVSSPLDSDYEEDHK